MKNKLILIITVLLAATVSYGQGEIDVLRMSRNDLNGTARGIAMGGAFGALGGDVTGIAINPAGLGVYRSSEVVGTMNFSTTAIETNWQNYKSSDDKFKFNFDNLSYIGYYPLGNETLPWINFGFSYNRLKNFQRQYTAYGRDMKSSLTDYIAHITNGSEALNMDSDYGDPYRSGVPWLGVLGWNGYLIDSDVNDPHNTIYKSPLLEGETVDPSLKVTENGHIESYDFSVGTNIADKFLLGLTFSITDIYYSMYSKYTEETVDGGFDLMNDFSTEGSGCQIALGAIYRPIDALRFGVSYHSPTWYALTDYFQGRSDQNFNPLSGGSSSAATPDGAYNDYKLSTPHRWTFSAAAILGQSAILSLDYELMDYRGMDLKYADGFEDKENNYFIDTDFKTSSTVRAGLEYRVTPQFSLRAGYAVMQQPYEKQFKAGNVQVMTVGTIPHYTIEGDISQLSFGLGYKFTPQFYIDAAYVSRTQTDDLYFFPKFIEESSGQVLLNSTPAQFKNNLNKVAITLGYKF